ncbi:DUF2254 family protein [Luedemannella flava]
MITLQLASSQYSPRVLRTFTQDRVVHVTLAVLLGTFTFAMTVMQTIRTDFNGRSAFVPRVSVTLAYVLALASVITLVLFRHTCPAKSASSPCSAMCTAAPRTRLRPCSPNAANRSSACRGRPRRTRDSPASRRHLGVPDLH